MQETDMNVASAAMVLGHLIPTASAGSRSPESPASGDDGLAGASLASLLVSIIEYCAPQGCVQLPAKAAGA